LPQNITIAAFTFGAVLLLIALIGGGFKIFGAEIPRKVPRVGRWVAGIIGTVLIIIGLSGVPKFANKTLTKAEEIELNYHLEAAAWCRENNRPRQALAHYHEALKIDEDNSKIIKAIETLQKQVGENSR
jgi:hypothetical protein